VTWRADGRLTGTPERLSIGLAGCSFLGPIDFSSCIAAAMLNGASAGRHELSATVCSGASFERSGSAPPGDGPWSPGDALLQAPSASPCSGATSRWSPTRRAGCVASRIRRMSRGARCVEARCDLVVAGRQGCSRSASLRSSPPLRSGLLASPLTPHDHQGRWQLCEQGGALLAHLRAKNHPVDVLSHPVAQRRRRECAATR
jgi:hypothetical protein